MLLALKKKTVSKNQLFFSGLLEPVMDFWQREIEA
jgi:hypothetical protein